jgi:hypothetical protein
MGVLLNSVEAGNRPLEGRAKAEKSPRCENSRCGVNTSEYFPLITKIGRGFRGIRRAMGVKKGRERGLDSGNSAEF